MLDTGNHVLSGEKKTAFLKAVRKLQQVRRKKKDESRITAEICRILNVSPGPEVNGFIDRVVLIQTSEQVFAAVNEWLAEQPVCVAGN